MINTQDLQRMINTHSKETLSPQGITLYLLISHGLSYFNYWLDSLHVVEGMWLLPKRIMDVKNSPFKYCEYFLVKKKKNCEY